MPPSSLIQRLKERKLVQWGAAYLAGAWVLLEVSDVVGGRWNLPDVLFRGFFILLAAGFFITLVLAWYHGEKGRQKVSGPELLMVAALLVVAGVALSFLTPRGSDPQVGRAGPTLSPEPEAGPPSLAVLPFEDLGGGDGSPSFAPGLHSAILTQLTGMADLRVIARPSVMEYEGARQSTREIAAALNARWVAEGSVQLVGSRLQVQVALIDPETDSNLWAHQYDRDLNDVFQVQSDIARQIAGALVANLTTGQRETLAQFPTENSEAYRFYLQGQDYWLRPGYVRGNIEAAGRLFSRALEADSAFALAHAALSRFHAYMYWFAYDRTEARREAQRSEAEEALRLQPDLPEAHLAMGQLHVSHLEFPEALREFQAALRLRPNDPEILSFIGFMNRDLGNWDAVEEVFQTAVRLNPRDAGLYADLAGNTYRGTRRFADAIEAFNRSLELAPDVYETAMQKAETFYNWQGQVDTLRAAVEALPKDSASYYWRAQYLVFAADGPGILELLRESPLSVMEEQHDYWPKPLLAAWAHRMMGSEAAAKLAFDSARVILEPLAEQYPLDERMPASLGYAYAGLGRGEEARALVEQFLRPWREAGDRYFGPVWMEYGAGILAQAGLAEEACDILEPLLAEPSRITVHTVRLDPRYEPVRSSPCVRTLLERYAEASLLPPSGGNP